MSTNGTIAVKHEDGTVSQIYTHWDSYIDHNGRILLENYATRDQVEALVALGHISCLGPTISATEYYGRDRGEDESEPETYSSLSTFFDQMICEEYNYLFADGNWLVLTSRNVWENLSDAVKNLANDA